MVERGKALALTVVCVFFSSVVSYYAGAVGLLPGVQRMLDAEETEIVDMSRVQEVKRYIDQKFVEDVDPAQLKAGATEGALRGMMEATGDKYSVYFDPEEYEAFLAKFEATFTGIGVQVELRPDTGLVTVVAPFKNSPGERAGLRPGDTILAVDGKDVRGLTLEEAVSMIKGPEGTQVTLTVGREGLSQPLEVTITREVIEFPTVESKMVDDGVGYVRLMEFSKEVTNQVSRAIEELRSQGATRLIFDLRMNGGGLLNEAIGVASLFLPPDQPVVHIVYRDRPTETFKSRAKQAFDMPLVVLVDENSASASEIVAGAVKDLNAGVLIGTTTFGKGSVQTFYRLSDGSGIKITTAKYLTAGGNSIHGVGVEPDVVVENPSKVLPGEPGDVQLERAIAYIKTMAP